MSDNEQMNENRETIDDIVFELREHDHEMIPPYLCFDEEGGIIIGALADRIEAAWARESKAIATENAVLPAVCITKPQGNAAAMREALELFVEYSELVCRMGIFTRDRLVEITTKAQAALSAPARNCDLNLSSKSLWDKFEDYMNDCGLPFYSEPSGEDAFDWLLEPAAERKGEGDGK